MGNLKTYGFKIITVRFENDNNSPHTIASFEFQAENLDKARAYMHSLREHFDKNHPYSSLLYPLQGTTDSDLQLVDRT